MNPINDNKSHSPSPVWIAIPALIAVNALWGLSFPVMKTLNEIVDQCLYSSDFPPTTYYRILTSSWMIGLRFSFAFAMLCVLFRKLVIDTTRNEWQAGIALGSIFYVGLVLQVIALATISASRSGFLTSLTAVFIPVIVTVFLRLPPSMNVTVGVVLALIGAAVLTGLVQVSSSGIYLAPEASAAWTIGDTYTTIAALFFSFQILFLDRVAPYIRSIAITPGMFASVAVLALLTSFFLLIFESTEGSANKQSFQKLIELLYNPVFVSLLAVLGGFCSLVSFLWMNRYQPSVSAVQASVIYSIEPVFASAWALILPAYIARFSGIEHVNESLTSQLVLGGSLVFLANIIAVSPKISLDFGWLIGKGRPRF